MNETPDSSHLSRRSFVFLGLMGAGAAGWMASRNPNSILKTAGENPFEYEVEAFEKVDPELVCFNEIRRRQFDLADVRKAIGADGVVYLVTGSQVLQLDELGNPVRSFPFDEPVKSVSLDADHSMVVALRRSWEKINLDTGQRKSFAADSERAFYSDILTHDGEVFLADSGSRRIQRLDWDGNLINTIGTEDSGKGRQGLVLPSPCLCLALGRDGLLRVNNPGRHRVEIYTKEGDLELFWGQASAGIEGFCGCCNPVSVTVMQDGRCVTAEKGIPRVKIHSPIGDFIGVVAGPDLFPKNLEAQKFVDRDESTYSNLSVYADKDDSVMVTDPVSKTLHQFEPIS